MCVLNSWSARCSRCQKLRDARCPFRKSCASRGRPRACPTSGNHKGCPYRTTGSVFIKQTSRLTLRAWCVDGAGGHTGSRRLLRWAPLGHVSSQLRDARGRSARRPSSRLVMPSRVRGGIMASVRHRLIDTARTPHVRDEPHSSGSSTPCATEPPRGQNAMTSRPRVPPASSRLWASPARSGG